MSLSSVELGELLGLFAAFAWGMTGLLVRAHGMGVNAIVINAVRNGISGTVFVVIWLVASGREPVPAAAWVFLALSMLTGLGIGDSLYFEALKRIGVTRAMPISMAYPVLASLGAVVLLHESMGPLAAVGIALTLGGVYLVAARPGDESSTRPAERAGGYWVGVALAATAAVSWSFSTLALDPALQLVDASTATAIRTPLASALLFAAAGRAGVLPQVRRLRGATLIAVVGTGVMSIASTGLFVVCVALAGAGRAAVLTATSPLFAVPLSVLLLGEPGSWRIVAGTLASVLGVILLAQT
ncbi:MAG: DMT family transporter [Chloroflexi bacterium]|nr:DMT family transporter [Chloroflexota bacterium]